MFEYVDVPADSIYARPIFKSMLAMRLLEFAADKWYSLFGAEYTVEWLLFDEKTPHIEGYLFPKAVFYV